MESAQVLRGLYRVFRQFDAQTVEVNPLALTDEDRIVAPSAVVVIDDQALFRHPELDGIADPERTNGWRPLTDLERQIRDIDKTDASSAIRFNEFEEGDIAFMITGGGSGFLALDLIQRLGGNRQPPSISRLEEWKRRCTSPPRLSYRGLVLKE